MTLSLEQKFNGMSLNAVDAAFRKWTWTMRDKPFEPDIIRHVGKITEKEETFKCLATGRPIKKIVQYRFLTESQMEMLCEKALKEARESATDILDFLLKEQVKNDTNAH